MCYNNECGLARRREKRDTSTRLSTTTWMSSTRMSAEMSDYVYKPYGYGIQCDMLDDWLTDQLCYYCGVKLIVPFTPRDTHYYHQPDHPRAPLGYRVLRDGYGVAVVDHRIARRRGGDNSPANLTWACDDCNNNKRTRSDREYIEEIQQHDPDKWELRNQRFMAAGKPLLVEFAPPLPAKKMTVGEIDYLRRNVMKINPAKIRYDYERLFAHIDALEAEIAALKAAPAAASPREQEA